MNFFLLLPADQKYDNDDAHQKKKKNQFHALYFVFNFFSKKNFFYLTDFAFYVYMCINCGVNRLNKLIFQ